MGLRGPAPKPTALKKLDGSEIRKPELTQQAKPERPTRAPAPPVWMSKAGKKQWRRIARPLLDCGLLTEIDLLALAMLCETYATYQDARLAIVQEGLLVAGGTGASKKNPAATVMETARKDLLTMMREFGMTPAARSRIRIEPDEEDDEDLFSQFVMAAKSGRKD